HFLDLALFQVTELERSIGETDEAAHRPAEMRADLADLAVLAFGEAHGEPGIVALLTIERCFDRAVAHAFDLDAVRQLGEGSGIDAAIDPHPVAPHPAG